MLPNCDGVIIVSSKSQQGRRSVFDIFGDDFVACQCQLRACAECAHRGVSDGEMWPPQKLENFVFLKLESWSVVNTLSQGFSTLLLGGPKEIQKYMLEDQMNTFWAFPMHFYVFWGDQRAKLHWLVGQIWPADLLLRTPTLSLKLRAGDEYKNTVLWTWLTQI